MWRPVASSARLAKHGGARAGYSTDESKRKTSLKPPRFRLWMLSAASTTLCLGVGEVLVRGLLPKPGLVAFAIAETRGVIQSDPDRGYRYASNVSRHIVTENYEIDFETNSLGMRDVELAEVAAGTRLVLAVGDSFTQGNGVQADESWPKRVQASLPGSHVFNAGVSGYGLQQMRRTAKLLVERIRPKAILVGVYGHGYSRLTDPYVVVGGDAGLMRESVATGVAITPDGYLLPVFQNALLKPVSFWIDQHWYVMGHILHIVLGPRTLGVSPALPTSIPSPGVLERDMAPMLNELVALDEDARRWGAPLAALLIGPVQPDGGIAPIQIRYNEIINAFARARKICLYDPTPALLASGLGPALRLGGDPHWSPRAHAIAAEAFLSALAAAEDDSEMAACASASRALRRS